MVCSTGWLWRVVCAFNQYYKSKISDDILKTIWKELNQVEKQNVSDTIEVYMKYKNDHLKIFKQEYESNFDGYTDINEEGMKEHINKN